MITKTYNRIKQGILWVKNNPKKALLAVLGVGVVGAAPILFPGTTEQNKNDILPITFNGKTISFPYTDDNTGETLIIKTDQESYSSWDSAYVHFAVKNITNDDQSVKVQFAYDGGASTSKVEEFKPQVSYQVEEPVYETKTYECKSGWEELIEGLDTKYTCKGDPKTARFCDSVDGTVCTAVEQTGTTLETRYKDEWGTILKDTVEDLKYKDVKPIDAKFVTKEQVTYWIPAGATKYFRAKLNFTPKSKGEFYINAYGHLNAAGHLDPFYDSAWGYRRAITLDYTKVGTTTPLTGFPLMFSTSTITDLKDTTNGGKVGKSDGTDILITESDGTTKLPHELEFYSSSTGETVLHFKSSTSTPISTSTATTYYLYYGNSGASDQQDTANVWDSDYKGVYHLKESAVSYLDSTSNAYHGTTTSGTVTQVTAQIYKGQNFAGTSYIRIPNFITSYPVTVEYWATTTVTTNNPQFNIVNTGINVAGGFSASGAYYYTGVNNKGGATSGFINSAWNHVVVIQSSSAAISVYTNGVDNSTTTNSSWGTGATSAIGARTTGGFTGRLDEFRVSNVKRSASWILTSYNNQYSPNTFWSVGAEETNTPAATGDAPGTAIFKGNTIFKGNSIIK